MKKFTNENIRSSLALMRLEKEIRRALEKSAQGLIAENFDPAEVESSTFAHAMIFMARHCKASDPKINEADAIRSFSDGAELSMQIAFHMDAISAAKVKQ